MAPLVSCIMPTHDRRAFVPLAIDYFLRQDYPLRELIVLDDGADPVADRLPPDPRIRYTRLEQEQGRIAYAPALTLGAVRNLACAAAYGEVIVHWDDDDWAAPWRISYQVEQLLAARADICGLDRLLYYDVRTGDAWQYQYQGGYGPWVAGSTLCYTREFWRGNPFPDRAVGEDNGFVWSRRPKRIAVLQEHTFYVGIIHAANSCPKGTRHRWWQPRPPSDVQRLMGADWASYR